MQYLQGIYGELEQSQQIIGAAAEENQAYHSLLTEPELLADYVNDFMGPNGPYPTELPQDRLAAEVAANSGYYGQQGAYARPQLDMPSPDVQASEGNGEFWDVFSQLSDRNPAAAWQLLSQATPDALRSKVLISEG